MIEAQQPQGEQPSTYLPAGPPDPLIFEDFEGIDTATLRPGVDDKKAAWLDGFMPLSKRNLRTMYGRGPIIWTTPRSFIACYDIVNIHAVPLAIVTLGDGSLYQVNLNTNVSTQMAGPGTLQNPSRIGVGVTTWASTYVIIIGLQTNGYFVWDGTTFYSPGQTVPGQGVVPLGTGGSTIETYQGRIWAAGAATVGWTAPGSFLDFSSANGGGNFTSADSFLRRAFIGLKQSNGFLYLIADSSINYISGVQTSGSPPITTFTNQNADPEVGSPWPGTIMVFGRNIMFANAFGAHVSYGGSVTKISEMLDGIYNTVPNFGNVIPSAAKAIIFGKKCWILLLTVVDPVSGQQTAKLFLWNNIKNIWWACSQEVPLTYINFQELDSVLTAWGTDGTSLFALFQQPSQTLLKIAQSRLWDAPGGYQFTKFVTRLWGIVKYYDPRTPTISITIDDESGTNVSPGQIDVIAGNTTWVTDVDLASTWVTDTNVASTWIGGGAYSVFSPQAVGQNGTLLGMTLQTQCADMAFVSVMMDAKIAGYKG